MPPVRQWMFEAVLKGNFILSQITRKSNAVVAVRGLFVYNICGTFYEKVEAGYNYDITKTDEPCEKGD